MISLANVKCHVPKTIVASITTHALRRQTVSQQHLAHYHSAQLVQSMDPQLIPIDPGRPSKSPTASDQAAAVQCEQGPKLIHASPQCSMPLLIDLSTAPVIVQVVSEREDG